MIGQNDELFWKKELNYLYEICQKERQEYSNFLTKKGHFPGTYIPNWNKLAEEFIKSKGQNYRHGQRIFGDTFRDFRLKNLVDSFLNEIIKIPDCTKKLFELIKYSDNDAQLQMFFISKLKKSNCDESLIKILDEKISLNKDHKLVAS